MVSQLCLINQTWQAIQVAAVSRHNLRASQMRTFIAMGHCAMKLRFSLFLLMESHSGVGINCNRLNVSLLWIYPLFSLVVELIVLYTVIAESHALDLNIRFLSAKYLSLTTGCCS